MRHFKVKKGEWPSVLGAAALQMKDNIIPASVAILGADFPGLRPRFEVEEGTRVKVGQVLFRDRKRPKIAFVSPIDGRVSSLAYGPRKTLSACIIVAKAVANESQSEPERPDPDDPRPALLDRGIWPAFRTRPFGRMPEPGAQPEAIFVNAVHADRAAPDPALVLSDQTPQFHLGIRILTRLTEGEVFVCQSRGTPLGPADDSVTHAGFEGTLAAALPSTHIDRLYAPATGREVWTIGYQDVAAIGHLFQTGQYRPNRVVAINGPAASRPRLVRTCLGAELADLAVPDAGEAISGNPVTGIHANYLRRFDHQVTLVEAQKTGPNRLRPAVAGHGALIPTRALEGALAVDIPPVPLLRALSVGDSEAAERLGVLALVEEDLAALTRHC